MPNRLTLLNLKLLCCEVLGKSWLFPARQLISH